MKRVQPKVYLIAKTELKSGNLIKYLNDIGSPKWLPDFHASGGEVLAEVAGRLCYRSWQEYDPEKPDATNPNVTKTRTGNKEYLENILKSGHGSVLEHISMTFLLTGVSRVFTHELVRHRAGMAYSQESLRYVRLDDLSIWYPELVNNNPEAVEKFDKVIKYLEGVQKELAIMFGVNEKDFHDKKKLTSMFRRLAPMGLSTTIMMTGNLRALRHLIEVRTSEAAEEEIRIVFKEIANICKTEYPNIFQDMDASGKVTYSKV